MPTFDIPAEPGDCKSLVWLDLNTNQLTGNIPLALFKQSGFIVAAYLTGMPFIYIKNDGSPQCHGARNLLEFGGIRREDLDRISSRHPYNDFYEREVCIINKKLKTEDERDQARSMLPKIFVATWNVAGKSPTGSLNLEDWFHTSPPADIYVLGFQEIVPLNAGNVLGTEDNGPAKKWVALIRKTLNSHPGTNSQDSDLEGSKRERNPSFLNGPSICSMRVMKSDMANSQPRLTRGYSVCDSGHNQLIDYDPNLGSTDEDNEPDDNSPESIHYPQKSYCGGKQPGNSRYCLVASKQMVGIYLTVWVKGDLTDDVRNMKVSCVGRGLMGYLGNKGSISISMSLNQTSFCFICSHLTSGQKEGDELRRNADVMEILRKTWFPRVEGRRDEKSPQTILEHDRVIWLGDLNYRIALSCQSAKALVEAHNWRALLDNDQLQIEKRRGRVFGGWSEGRIDFPPTYKYSNNSDRYACDDIHPKEKRRTPAWCDRILWYGRGLHQISYVRGESRFSDHRPVCSIFIAETNITLRGGMKKSGILIAEVKD
ncbi:hypothetical protein L1887_13178 [Cichorium endivia]|nr:hypothetical protein L1887_13178 [Cichorium endivia]